MGDPLARSLSEISSTYLHKLSKRISLSRDLRQHLLFRPAPDNQVKRTPKTGEISEWMCNTARETEAATQPLCHSARMAAAATQPLSHSARVAAAATQPLSHSARVAAAATQPLSHPGRAADAATQPLCQSGWTSHSATQSALTRAAEWLSVCPSHSAVAGAEFYV